MSFKVPSLDFYKNARPVRAFARVYVFLRLGGVPGEEKG